MLQSRLPVSAALVALSVVAGCGSHATTTTADAFVTTGVPCASVQCAPCADQFCDTADYGVTGSCRAHVAANNLSFGCDGPEDCGAQGALGLCCFLDGLGAACSSAGCGNNGLYMCHHDGDCATGEHCCKLAAGTTYSVCKAGC